MKIQTGTAYYPELWNKERVRYDADLMQKAGIRLVRMAEFAWSHLEPREGVFDFQWLHDAVDIFAGYGIKTVLCTPSSAAPAWMCRKYPEILRMDRNGTRATFGKRDHTCYTSEKYRFFIVRMAEKMAESFKDDPNIVAWQIDNEPGCSGFPECFCPECQRKFREHVRNKFKTVENLNECWKTAFWSGEYTDWDELELDARCDWGAGFCRQVESDVFRSEQLIEFLSVQADAIHRIIPSMKIGTNMAIMCNRKELAKKMDFLGDDRYHKYAFSERPYTRMMMDHYREIKPGVSPWLMETQIFPGWPRHDFSRYYYWFHIGHGMEHIFFFLWNNHLAGDEKLNYAVIGPTGIPGRKYENLKKMIQESDVILEKYDTLPMPEATSAVVFDYFGDWVYMSATPNRQSFHWNGHVHAHDLLRRNGEAVDVITPDSDLTRYKLLVLPILPVISPEVAEKLKKFVADGGVVVMNGRSGMFDQYGKNLTAPGPENLHDLFGFVMGENMEIDRQEMQPAPKDLPIFEDTPEFEFEHTLVHGELDGQKVVGTTEYWCAELNIQDAEVLLTYKNSVLQGLPFLTQKKYGKGYAIYYAADGVDRSLLRQILRHSQKLAGLSTYEYPEGIDVSTRGDLMILTNENNREIRFRSPVSGTNLLGTPLQGEELVLPPYSASVLRVKE